MSHPYDPSSGNEEYPPYPAGDEQTTRYPTQRHDPTQRAPQQESQQGPPPQGPPPPGTPLGGYVGNQPPSGKGFFGALFDFSFSYFVTPMIVKVAYILVTIALALGWFVGVIAGFSIDPAIGLLYLILGGIVAFIYLILTRMTFEFYVAIVRMSEDIHHRLPR